MKTRFITALACVLAACGIKARDEKQKLNDNTVSFSPDPGAYSFKPMIKMSKKDNSTAVDIFVKVPGETDFKLAGSCSGTLYGTDASDQSVCVEMPQSGTLSYYLQNGATQSDEKSVEYQVALVQNNIELESRTLPDDLPEQLTLSEIETKCSFLEDNSRLYFMVQATSFEKLTDQRYAYITMILDNPAAGAVSEFTEASDWQLGVDIKRKGEEPAGYGPNSTYSTIATLKDEDGNVTSKPFCKITGNKINRAGLSKGSFTCSEVARYIPGSETYLGGLISFSGEWQCDSFSL